jgi:hypothetical protein
LPDAGSRLAYRPLLLAAATINYSSARLKIDEQRSLVLAVAPDDGPVSIDWNGARTLDLAVEDLESNPEEGAGFFAVPGDLSKPANYRNWERELKRWLRLERPLTIYQSPSLKEYSRPDESERDFRIRLQQFANEARDLKVAKLRQRYDAKVVRLEERLRRAEQAIEREAEQARGAKLDTAISFGTAILGAVLGRKRISTTSASRVGTAVRKAGSARKQAGDVRRAQETAESVQVQLEELQRDFEQEVDGLDAAFDAQSEELRETQVRPKATEIRVSLISIGWEPVVLDANA